MAQLEFPQDPQARLTAIVEDIDFLTVALHDLVAEYIDQDILTWQQVGDATGMTRQAAWEKHTHARLGKKRSPNTRS